MNAASISPANRDDGSDSESNPDDLPEYYQPISAGGDDGEDSDEQVNSDEEHHRCYNNQSLSNGISSLHVSDDSSEEEEERSSESAMVRAFREDESRRRAPLTAENATRVIEAMRGVSFAGMAPAWADQVPENQWIDRIRRLRQPPGSARTVQN